MKTSEMYFYRMCDEIDYWKEKADYWKSQFEEERKSHTELLNHEIESSNKGVANMLMLALYVSDSPNGDLVITKKDRKQLADNYKG